MIENLYTEMTDVGFAVVFCNLVFLFFTLLIKTQQISYRLSKKTIEV